VSIPSVDPVSRFVGIASKLDNLGRVVLIAQKVKPVSSRFGSTHLILSYQSGVPYTLSDVARVKAPRLEPLSNFTPFSIVNRKYTNLRRKYEKLAGPPRHASDKYGETVT